ncbi:PadR family transcriptional regulator [Cytobacillus sp. FSL W7-1323]|uniref:PadR family transcriptional regulator n=1 Tax=Cytobacillus TaxID=2675230 RepID=UPI0027863DF3|nr:MULTISPECIES: PadR family transcriptional regulator [Cytobacillus]MDQ0185814.1 DNA-binding PadR family transcriptional regulator [Cytobacillus kochii]MEA1853556.1 PadR family transcriptional regulator [Cytobacillus sp. OWB-43]MED1604987.1 PadR family transcriptional regulator [Cytobacillus kochii]
MDKEIMKGSIDILLLSLLSKKNMYGYEMVKSLKENSHELYNMSEGTLYPALKRLEKNGWIEAYWEDSQLGGRRKYYQLTNGGKTELSRKLGEWQKVNDLINVTTEGLKWTKRLNPISTKL